MSQAKWIWYHGDYELYHSILLHSRREEFGCEHPAPWSLSTPYLCVGFYTAYHAEGDDVIRAVTPHKGYIMVDSKRYPTHTDISVPAGDHMIRAVVSATEGGFPCIYVSGKYLNSDESWVADHLEGNRLPVGCEPAYLSPDDDPKVFPFAYERKDAEKVTATGGGLLYDFGRELFGLLHIEGSEAPVEVTYGESVEEALDPENAIICETLAGSLSYTRPARAFRYICLKGEDADKLTVWADYEYLPLADKASFTCNRSMINKIWEVCAYTLHLNSREFFLDGIKRDRWVWCGDSYQSSMADRYLYFDPAIIKRTYVALLGKPPYEQHINTINDYSMYLIIGAYEYYFATGDADFIKLYYPRLRALYDFIDSRLDENGYVVGKPGDWIFIDWSDMDKGGPLCAEQILYWQCRNAMAALAEIVGLDGTVYRRAAEKLKKNILRDYWREDRGAFIDCHTTGRENVTRHANIFAILYDFVSPKRARRILTNVLENDSVTKITTPYFEFFELTALCKMGRLNAAQKVIESYWGGMINLGATSIWEQYVPEKQGAEHYEMYNMKYGCSLCHAWGGGPIYLLGRYCLGVYPTSVGYETFAVEPKKGSYKYIEGSVPLPEGGLVKVYLDAHICRVTANRKGGKLILKGKEYMLTENEELTVEF